MQLTGADGVPAPSSLSDGLSLLMKRLMGVVDVAVGDAVSDVIEDAGAKLKLASAIRLAS